MAPSKSAASRFWSRVRRGGGCWEWSGWRMPRGYGQLRFGGRQQYAHRVAWQLRRGPIPDRMCVCHKCDNPSCVRPGHLFLGTQLDNVRDMIRKGRRRAYDRSGERNPRAIMTADGVRELRSRAAKGESPSALASSFGISKVQAYFIIQRRSWSTIT